MKKNKILVPALGLLALSTVASVTGTVAWFTANAKVTVPFSNFEVVKLTSDLSVTSTAKLGTTVNSDGTVVPTQYITSKYATLTHASVNCDTSDLWTKSTTNATIKQSAKSSAMFDNFAEGNIEAMTAKKDASGKVETLYAFAWTSTFGYTVANAGDKVNLYFDVTSAFDYGTNSNVIRTGCGFRLAMIKSDNSFVVWSPAQKDVMCYNDGSYPQTDADPSTDIKKNSCYVLDATHVTDYTTGKTGNLIFKGDTSVSVIDSASKGELARKDCLGQFTSTVTSIAVTFIAWFEGEDPNVVDNGICETVSADLGFYIRDNLAA